MEEQELFVNPGAIYRDPTLSIPQETWNPENRGTRIFVSIYFGFRFFAAFLAGFVPTAILLVLISMTQWKPIIMLNVPSFAVIAVLFPFISIYTLYLFFKVRTLSYKGWLLVFTIFVQEILYSLGMVIIVRDMMVLAVKAVQGNTREIPSIFSIIWASENPASFVFLFLDILVFIIIVLIWFKLKKNFTNENSKISKKSRLTLAGYTIFIIIAVAAIYAPLFIASREKPFMGYKQAVSDLGFNPVLFQVPGDYHLDYVFNANTGLTFSYFGDYDSKKEKDLMNWILISESTKSDEDLKDFSEHITINNEDVRYMPPRGNGTSRHALMMHKNGLLIMIAGIDSKNVSKQTLIDIAKTAQ